MLLHVKEKDYNDEKEFFLFQEVVHLLFKLPLIAKSIILEKKLNTGNIWMIFAETTTCTSCNSSPEAFDEMCGKHDIGELIAVYIPFFSSFLLFKILTRYSYTDRPR